MPVAVTGASGFIGSAVVRKLVERERVVRVLLEPGASTRNLDPLPQELIERRTVDICDREALLAALDGCDVLYHLAAVYKDWLPDPSLVYRVNVEGTTHVLLAAQKLGLSKIVYTSSIAALGVRGDGKLIDESTAFNYFDGANHYILTKYLAERVAMNFAQAGLPVVVVNPAFPFGAGDIGPTPTGRIIVALLRGQVPVRGAGGFCAVDVDDVAEAHVAAETRGRVGQRYILGNHNITLNDFFDLVGRIAGVKSPRVPVPKPVGAAVALGMELFSDHVSHREPLTTYRSIRYAQQLLFYDNARARTELGLACTPLEQTISRAVRWFREAGMV
ncbi:MAG: NAD-dependent epimerase/dehydratase family protein [Deltaproteobacteria bacterium]|nr:NAD-dependent epimerase/dehydratase family protein [Deltaproteobacteria bacterium]